MLARDAACGPSAPSVFGSAASQSHLCSSQNVILANGFKASVTLGGDGLESGVAAAPSVRPSTWEAGSKSTHLRNGCLPLIHLLFNPSSSPLASPLFSFLLLPLLILIIHFCGAIPANNPLHPATSDEPVSSSRPPDTAYSFLGFLHLPHRLPHYIASTKVWAPLRNGVIGPLVETSRLARRCLAAAVAVQPSLTFGKLPEPACRILHTILCVVDCFAAVRLQLQLSPTLAEPRSVACSDLLGGLIQRSSSHIIPPPLARMPCCRAAWLGLFGHIGIAIWLLRSAFELRAQMSSKLPLRLPLAVTPRSCLSTPDATLLVAVDPVASTSAGCLPNLADSYQVVSVSTSWFLLFSEALIRPPLPHWSIGVLVGHPSAVCFPQIPFPPLSFPSSPPWSSMQAHETDALPSSSFHRHPRPTSSLNRRIHVRYRLIPSTSITSSPRRYLRPLHRHTAVPTTEGQIAPSAPSHLLPAQRHSLSAPESFSAARFLHAFANHSFHSLLKVVEAHGFTSPFVA
ncbi:hypothetical protein PaG_05218 [Moesziomyces aphidis]|uniref:Uncharacterized protein n=1 Tax=Moesziomyces aphidis TaxID=84754 RepID=W3VIA5_MOEAP|nr:hypothetical protein PaG_05218 [Moesziomyces aphidis]